MRATRWRRRGAGDAKWEKTVDSAMVTLKL